MTLNTLALAAQCLLTLSSLASLCLATPRYLGQVRGNNLQLWRSLLRITGWALIAIATTVGIGVKGWSLGLVSLFGALTLAAFAVLGVASYYPKGLVPAALTGAIGAITLASATWLGVLKIV